MPLENSFIVISHILLIKFFFHEWITQHKLNGWRQGLDRVTTWIIVTAKLGFGWLIVVGHFCHMFGATIFGEPYLRKLTVKNIFSMDYFPEFSNWKVFWVIQWRWITNYRCVVCNSSASCFAIIYTLPVQGIQNVIKIYILHKKAQT